MTTTSRKDFAAELAAYDLRFIVVSDDADVATLDAAIIVLSAKKAKACIASTKDEIQADIDELLERRTALSVT